MEKNTVKVTFKGGAVTLLGAETKIGQQAADFTLVGAGMGPLKLSDYTGKVKILSVFPSIDTAVCAMQTRKFNQEAANLGDVVIIAISNDLPFAQSRFCAAEGIDKVVTGSDYKDLDFSKKYGFLIENLRLLARGVVVIDKNDIVQHIEYVSEVTHEPNYNAALDVAKKLL